jgi:hypothetical protein
MVVDANFTNAKFLSSAPLSIQPRSTDLGQGRIIFDPDFGSGVAVTFLDPLRCQWDDHSRVGRPCQERQRDIGAGRD